MRPRRSTRPEIRALSSRPRYVPTTASGLYSPTLFVMLRWCDGLDRRACVARRSPRCAARTGSRRGRARTVVSRPNCVGPSRRSLLGTDRRSARLDPTGRAGVLHPRCPHRDRRQRRHARAAARRDRGHRLGGRRGTGLSTAARRALRCRREGRHRRQRIRIGGHSARTVTPHRRRMAGTRFLRGGSVSQAADRGSGRSDGTSAAAPLDRAPGCQAVNRGVPADLQTASDTSRSPSWRRHFCPHRMVR